MSRGRNRGRNRGRGRGRGSRHGWRHGRGRGTSATPVDQWSVQAVGAAETASCGKENDGKISLAQLFTSDSNFDSHYAAQEADCNKYLATLLVLQKNGVDISQGAKIRALAVAWARKDHKLAKKLLLQTTEFGVVEILKAVTLLDAGRKIRVWEKKAKKLQMQPKFKPKKIGKIKSNIDNLNMIKPKTGSVSGALSRHIRQWVKEIPASQLEFYALHYPKEPWKRLADICHLNPKKDFPELPWFLPFCFGEPAPDGTMVSRCALVNADNVNELVASYEVPYTHIKDHKLILTTESKKRIAQYESKLDTVLWYYEDLNCPKVDEVMVKRLKAGEKFELPYGKVMERLLMLKMMERDSTANQDNAGSEVDGWGSESKIPFFDRLVDIAEDRLKNTSLSLETPVVVIGDRSPSMGVAVRTSTIIAGVLCAISKAKLCFFGSVNYDPPTMPRNIKEILHLATSIETEGMTCPAASLMIYYEAKEVVKTFIIVTDEEENTTCKNFRFAPLFKKYYDEIYPARLVFVSFLTSQHGRAQMQEELIAVGIKPLEFRLDNHRPDLTKLDNLLGMLAKESISDFDEDVEKMKAELAANQFADDVATIKLLP